MDAFPQPRVVFLTGAARSGTTWVQNLLGSHPEIATPQESDLFSRYIAQWHREWKKSLPDDYQAWADRRHNGLPSILTEKEFDEIVRGVINHVYVRAGELKPSASIVLDKVPGYGFYAGLLFRYLPDARVLHLIRDGRDVVASMRRASQGFGRLWASDTVDYGAFAWSSTVKTTQEMGQLEAYAECRYEDMRGADGARNLSNAFRFLGVEVDQDEASEILRRFSLERNRGRPPSSMVWGGEVIQRLGKEPEEPSDFFGKGSTGGWREKFTKYDRWLFDRYAGGMLVELGYERDSTWVGAGRWFGVIGHVRFSFERWRVLVATGFGKIRRNLKPRERSIPVSAVPLPPNSVELPGREGV